MRRSPTSQPPSVATPRRAAGPLSPSTDAKLVAAVGSASRAGNLVATTDERAFALASVAIVNVPLDVVVEDGRPKARFEPFCSAVRTLGRYLPPGALVLVETTVPPGTCEKVVAPEL